MDTTETYFLKFEHNDFKKGIEDLVNKKKNMLVHLYGAPGRDGRSWCPDCDISEPYIKEIKPFVKQKENEKEIYFIDIPISWEKRSDYRNNKILKEKRIPTLIYFYQGREMGRLVEREMANRKNIFDFVEQIYEDDY
jgi:thiol-disulfide isomerase/thioredoxin